MVNHPVDRYWLKRFAQRNRCTKYDRSTKNTWFFFCFYTILLDQIKTKTSESEQMTTVYTGGSAFSFFLFSHPCNLCSSTAMYVNGKRMFCVYEKKLDKKYCRTCVKKKVCNSLMRQSCYCKSSFEFSFFISVVVHEVSPEREKLYRYVVSETRLQRVVTQKTPSST